MSLVAVMLVTLSTSHNEKTSSATIAAQEPPAPAATIVVQETPAPAAATIVIQESPAPTATTMAVQEPPAPPVTTAAQEPPAPVNADGIKLTVAPPKPGTDVASPAAEPHRVDPPAAIDSTPALAKIPAAKRAVAARQHSAATRERASRASARVGPYPGYATGLFSPPDFFSPEYRRQNGAR
jgi:hypothetical protein